jgi:signal transduction histidine kinase
VTLAARNSENGVALEVADTGQGIGPEHLPNIFERFYRADQSRHQASGGSGLGLAIVRSIVEAHSGRVAVESTAGRGTVFTITLPVEPGSQAKVPAIVGAQRA